MTQFVQYSSHHGNWAALLPEKCCYLWVRTPYLHSYSGLQLLITWTLQLRGQASLFIEQSHGEEHPWPCLQLARPGTQPHGIWGWSWGRILFFLIGQRTSGSQCHVIILNWVYFHFLLAILCSMNHRLWKSMMSSVPCNIKLRIFLVWQQKSRSLVAGHQEAGGMTVGHLWWSNVWMASPTALPRRDFPTSHQSRVESTWIWCTKMWYRATSKFCTPHLPPCKESYCPWNGLYTRICFQ